MPTHTLDARAARLDVLYHPGNTASVVFTFPAALTGRTFTATAGATSPSGSYPTTLTAPSVVGATVTVSITEAQTTALAVIGRTVYWKLTETTGGGTQDLIAGKLTANEYGSGSVSTSATVTLSSSAVTVDVVSNLAAASAQPFTPVGTIAATNTQAAVAEVATDAAALVATEAASRVAADLLRPAFGAVLVEGETAAQIQAKADACATADTTLFIPDGDWTPTSTVIFRCHVESAAGATFTSDASPVIQLGDDSAAISERRFVLPKVIRANKAWAAGSIESDIGVAVHRLYASDVWVPQVKQFAVGVACIPAVNACSYNRFFLGHLENNAVNLLLDPTTGWVNENWFYGGRASHYSLEGADVAGTAHVKIVHDGAHQPNNNHFFGLSVEGNTAEFHLDCNGGSCIFEGLRWEATIPKVRWGAASGGNVILYGYNAHSIVETHTAGSSRNHLYTRDRVRLIGSGGADGLLLLENTSSSGNPTITLLRAGGLLLGDDPETAYEVAIGANAYRGKRHDDVNDRIVVDHENGRFYMGNASVAATAYVGALGAATVGVGASNWAPATTDALDLGTSSLKWRDLYLTRVLKLGPFATGARPTAASAGAGGVVYDTTLSKPIYSDGTTWRDAAGNAV